MSPLERALAEAGVEPIDKWLGPAWLCPNCGRICRKAPNKNDHGERFHSYRCNDPMVRVRIAKPTKKETTC